MVGHLYDGPDDPRGDGGFTVFYMGINIGAFAAPLVIGTVGQWRSKRRSRASLATPCGGAEGGSRR
jgi:dipeptide/tripeptide permease